MSGTQRGAVVGAVLIAVVVAFGGIAAAVSGGGYNPSQQDCTPLADAYNRQGAEPGCHNFKVNVEDSKGHRYAQAGIAQEAQRDNPHAADFAIDSNGDGRGLGAAGGVDTNYQPLTPDSCGLFDVATVPIDELLFLAGQGHQPCSLTPAGPPAGAPTVTGPAVHTGTPNGNAADLANNASVYLGADDNLDTGEHDGVDGEGKTGTKHSANGPSDGGAVVVNWHPAEVLTWLTALTSIGANPGAVLSNPIPLLDAGFGMCADGVCLSTQTRERTVYQGGSAGQRDVYNYDGKNWDPAECSSGSLQDEQACHGDGQHAPKNMDDYRKAEKANVVAQPGVQFYEDPDAEGSPIGPYPLPAAYAGTCGVVLGGGAAPAAPDSPVTNSAGQVVVSTGC